MDWPQSSVHPDVLPFKAGSFIYPPAAQLSLATTVDLARLSNEETMAEKMLPSPATSPLQSKNRVRQWAWSLPLLGVIYLFATSQSIDHHSNRSHHVPLHAQKVLAECASFKSLPGPTPNFSSRLQSERFEAGTKAQYIYNATIWTGLNDGNEGVSHPIVVVV